ncbi:MAG: peptidylprolyl isomerase, partial [Planctomycetes bacterium]|nr:peptidylprolyl isomerase [Planctomycetota bacterium]
EALPETRAARVIVVATATRGAPPGEAERAKAARALAEVRAGVPFESVVARFSSGPSKPFDGVLGTFTRGVLLPELDEFLFSAEVGALSPVLETDAGLQILQRIERDAACAMIQIDLAHQGGRELVQKLRAELDAGADFAELARKYSDERVSGERGGLYRIFERSPHDALLKKAAFELAIGAHAGPIETPIGWHLIRRLPLDAVPASLRESSFARVRAFTIAWSRARGANPALRRNQDEARILAEDLRRRLQNGEDMEAIARCYDDDPVGRARGGDLGWVLRRSPIVPSWLDVVFLTPLGQPTEILATDFGWVIARRER